MIVFGIKLEIALATICCVLIILLVLYIVTLVAYKKLNRKYKLFMAGESSLSLEKLIQKRLDEIDLLKSDNENTKHQLEQLNAKSLVAYQKVALLKYDAFQEMGGKLSYSLCMMDGNEDGLIMTSMHSSREGCYTYVKEIIKGEAFVLLSKEEKQVLEEAKAKGYHYTGKLG